MSVRVVTVFGGTGFLGRRVVDHLRKQDFIVRIASRHANRGRDLFGPDGPQLQSLEVDIHDAHAVADALAGAYAAVNAVSLYVERGGETFHSVHVEAASRLAARAQQDGLERLVQVSGGGGDPPPPPPPRRRSISASEGRANWRCAPPSPTQSSFGRR
jgi:uncharacterized protein YbjT (DUF2867 family)